MVEQRHETKLGVSLLNLKNKRTFFIIFSLFIIKLDFIQTLVADETSNWEFQQFDENAAIFLMN